MLIKLIFLSIIKYKITPIQVDIDVAIGIIINPKLLKKEILIIRFTKTIKDEILKGVIVLSLAKKNLQIFLRRKMQVYRIQSI